MNMAILYKINLRMSTLIWFCRLVRLKCTHNINSDNILHLYKVEVCGFDAKNVRLKASALDVIISNTE
jgi:hypothetical protein